MATSPEEWQPENDPGAALLWRLVCELKTQFTYERSFGIRKGAISPKRFLLVVSKDSIGGNYRQEVTTLWRHLGLPATLQNAAEPYLQGATFLGFGYEANQKSNHYKVYLQMQLPPNYRRGSAPVLLFVGFKWDATECSRTSFTRYYCHPSLSVLGLLRRIKALYGKGHSSKSFDVVRGILSLAEEHIGQGAMRYLEAIEDLNPRRSFDVNLYSARLTMSRLSPFFTDICQQFFVPIKQLDSILGPNHSSVVGHLSGGVHRAGEEFFTVYYGAEDRPQCEASD